ncbi:insulin-like growth factor-binding protein complex acid labile subunit [Anopheles ziemanni]|uniref:insulin-like growth factor-binding protein complex acid labile subunit n=1 Tax=Anopheles coustani TaxID=139045 RepID=UPI00265A5983|nr:insulin-like growth factor-binding protein complex acid labile subunit [Anopheles coustani]XP_058171421.1 insulin-like growth factor-binding protein complex acid labile subunit [Anopheles ziemanni]
MKCQLVLLVALAVVMATGAVSYCPNRCVCDDEKLHVTCGEGELDVLPIALNPSIGRLVIKFNRIKSIDSSIQFYTELTMLDLSYNHLLSIPERIFMYQKKLLQLHLNNNKIGAITNKTFGGLDELRVLNLRGNFIDEIGVEMFKVLPKLEELNLGQNRIATLHASAFEGLANLRVLYLDDNSISTIPTLSLTPLRGLAELYLGTNSLFKVLPGAFEGLGQLRRLDIHGSMLVNITSETFRGLENIRSLDISDNHLLKVPTVQLSGLKRLEDLTIGQNDFEVIPEGAFFGLSNLKSIDISGALNLRQIQSGAFSANPNLESITVASNKELQELDEGAFAGLPHLRKVSLRDNKIGTFHEELLPWKHLVEFDLTENPLVCDCSVLWLRNLLQRQSPESQDDSQIVCTGPDRLHGEPLRDLTADLLGCQHLQSKERAIFGAIIVASAASVTTVVLIVYRLRHRILDAVRRKGWAGGNKRATLQEEKDVEVQKSLGEVEYHQPHCNIYTYNYHPAYRNYQHPFGGQYTLPYPHYQTHGQPPTTLQHHPHHHHQHHQQQQSSSPAASIVAVSGGYSGPQQQQQHQQLPQPQSHPHQQPPLPQTPKGPLSTSSSTTSSSTSSSALSSSGSTVSGMSAQTQSSTIYSPQYAHHIYEVPKNVADT